MRAAAVPPERLAQFENPQVLLNPQASAMRRGIANTGPQDVQLADAAFGAIKVALATSLHEMFLVCAVIVASGAFTVVFLKEIPFRMSYHRAEAQEPQGSIGARPAL